MLHNHNRKETNMNSAITIMSHKNAAFAGAHDLRTAQDGILLAVTRTPLHCAARRLREEGMPDSTVLTIRDADGVAADIVGTIKDALA
jgi:hypothetical protein